MSDKYYTSFTDYFYDNNPKPKLNSGFRHSRSGNKSVLMNYIHKQKELATVSEYNKKMSVATSEYNKQMESQKTELEALRSGQPKTVNYGTAISVDRIESDEDRARAAALEQLEKERLGANIVSMGQTSLLRGLK